MRDLTEVPTDEGKLHLATVLDLTTRRLPGFTIVRTTTHHWPGPRCAVAVRGGQVAGVVFHSDKGGEYTGDVFAGACTAPGAIQSTGRGRTRSWTTPLRKASTALRVSAGFGV